MGIFSKMKWSLLVVLTAGLVFSPFPAFAQSSNPLSNVQSYKIYYDYPTDAILNQMQAYDAVMIEPVLYTKDQIETIQQSGTLVYGYINTMEADNWNTALISQLEESDFFHRDGERVYYPEWDSYLTDITSDHYQQVLLAEIEKQITAKGLDGVFLDTVGNIDNEHCGSDVLDDQRAGMAVFLQEIRRQHPSLSLIQNWGFGTLSTTTYPYVDGIMWENFNYSTVSTNQWSQNRIEDLQQLQTETGLEVLTVSFTEKTKSTNYAASKNFKHYHESSHYNAW
ncbi:endo alpha-1,4 polygalactosaminidase [Halobacillus litoralis]|uniref:endo alpha-1,4 polygalactosaminidase n=1 Tax=Halobacillus litoralis TaxID=45668 RepID=UPI00137097D8|nr:endo alpha-1,4 polygalactosaminidase [Halobacillus litoralis]MYL37440.1 glycosyl hydrolase [Halobacillus litoralis]